MYNYSKPLANSDLLGREEGIRINEAKGSQKRQQQKIEK
jgi:hypothetical protein